MERISKIDLNKAAGEVKKAAEEHVRNGYRITNEKLTLLHNVTAFHVLEEESYVLDGELQKLIGKRAADFYEYAISVQNDCIVCSTYFSRLLKKNHIEFETFAFTEKESLLIAYGRAIAKDPKNVGDELFGKMRQAFSEEEMVVITAMGVMMIANNYFNDILQVAPEEQDTAEETGTL